MALLRRGDMSVTDVCLAVGFTSLGSFSSTFTRLVGEPPSAYRGRDHTSMARVPPCVARTWTRPGWIGPGGTGPRPEQSRIGEARRAATPVA
jgi:Helix-turn-helix domain